MAYINFWARCCKGNFLKIMMVIYFVSFPPVALRSSSQNIVVAENMFGCSRVVYFKEGFMFVNLTKKSVEMGVTLLMSIENIQYQVELVLTTGQPLTYCQCCPYLKGCD